VTPDRDPARIIAAGQPLLAAAPGTGGHIAANLLAFTRLLRRSGLPLGPGEALSALAALNAIEIGDRRQVHAALRAVMVHRREHLSCSIRPSNYSGETRKPPPMPLPWPRWMAISRNRKSRPPRLGVWRKPCRAKNQSPARLSRNRRARI